MSHSRYIKPILLWSLFIIVGAALTLLFGTNIIYPERGARMVTLEESSRGEGNRDKLDDEQWMREVTVTDSGVVQRPPSLDDEPSTLEERIIRTMQKENQEILEDLNRLKAQEKELETDLELLRELAQRPGEEGTEASKMAQERKRISVQIRELLESSPDSAGLNEEEKQIVAYAAIEGYMEIMRRSRLGMSERLKQEIAGSLMPDYSFCLGEGLPFVATTHAERTRLLEYLQSDDLKLLQRGHMREDYEVISQECFSDLILRINRMINAG